ncbi:Hpt domain-containing protein, partial [Paracoccus sanguinis]|uniref:Hpt domain-containing protein n=1 Tax=Paracoccus sanguinis TaxID=1545044 RepID=UPI00155AEDE4
MSTDPMAEIRASFFVECEELMESLQDALVILDEDGGDAETINVVFRAVHSIKGGAGAFGFDALVGFAHRFETVLDQLRAGKLALTPEATRLFIQGADLLHDHIRAAQYDEPPPAGAEPMLAALEALMGDAAPVEDEPVDFTPSGLGFSLDLPGFEGFGPLEAEGDEPAATDATDSVASDLPAWRIDFTPHADLFTSGNEPLLILRALAALGEAELRCHVPDDLSSAPEAAEAPRLGWTILLQGDVTEAEIREVFDFVTDVCDLTIAPAATPLPPGGPEGGTDPFLADDPVESAMSEPPLPETPQSELPLPADIAATAGEAPPLRLDADTIVAAANADEPTPGAAPRARS